jgi:hypothetical protein
MEQLQPVAMGIRSLVRRIPSIAPNLREIVKSNSEKLIRHSVYKQKLTEKQNSEAALSRQASRSAKSKAVERLLGSTASTMAKHRGIYETSDFGIEMFARESYRAAGTPLRMWSACH